MPQDTKDRVQEDDVPEVGVGDDGGGASCHNGHVLPLFLFWMDTRRAKPAKDKVAEDVHKREQGR